MDDRLTDRRTHATEREIEKLSTKEFTPEQPSFMLMGHKYRKRCLFL